VHCVLLFLKILFHFIYKCWLEFSVFEQVLLALVEHQIHFDSKEEFERAI